MRRLTQGQTSHPLLTHVGREQARAAADIIASDLADRQERLERLVTSDLVRAVETAASSATHLVSLLREIEGV